MRMNRRKVLTALGGITIGGGALFGTGAFSTVSAERTVTVNVDGDGSALIALAPNGAGTTSSVIDSSDGTLEINFDAAANTDEGLNLDAKTTVGTADSNDNVASGDQAFDITNNSDETVNLDFNIGFNSNQVGQNIEANNGVSDVLKLYADTTGATNATVGSTGDTGNFVSKKIQGMTTGETARVALEVNLIDQDSNDLAKGSPLFASPATITATRQ